MIDHIIVSNLMLGPKFDYLYWGVYIPQHRLMGMSISVSPPCYYASDQIVSLLPGGVYAQFECFSVGGCGNFTQVGGSTAEDCCLGDGQSYRLDGGSACQQCIGNNRL